MKKIKGGRMKHLRLSLLSTSIALALLFDLFFAIFWLTDRMGARPWPFTKAVSGVFEIVTVINIVAVFALVESTLEKKGLFLGKYAASFLALGILIGFLIAWLGGYSFNALLWWHEIQESLYAIRGH